METKISAKPAAWPFRLAALIFLVTSFFFLWQMLAMTGGEVVFPLDDPYIHLAMARNIVESGPWGVNPGEFTSSSSSPFWTALLAALLGIFDLPFWWPIILNLAFGLILLFWWHRSLPAGLSEQKPLRAFFFLLALIFFLPMPTLALLGMEHLLHTLLMFVCVNKMVGCLRERAKPSMTLLVLIAAGTATRYESLFLYLPLILAAFWKGLRRTSVIWTAFSVLPIAVYAASSVYMGWYWAPNSILLKGRNPIPGSSEGLYQFYPKIDSLATLAHQAPHLLAMLALVLFLLALVRWSGALHKGQSGLCFPTSLDNVRKPEGSSTGRETFELLAFSFTVGALLQVGLARVGWFFRYESYLLPIGALAALKGWVHSRIALNDTWLSGPRKYQLRLIRFFILAVALLVLGGRGLAALNRLPTAYRNIWQQQVQMGNFLNEHFAGSKVILNDIGAPACLGRVYVIDLWGLGTLFTAARIRTGSYFSDKELGQLARETRARIAILSSGFFPIPAHWKRAGTWTIPDNQVCASQTVEFYAITDEAEVPLRNALKKQTAILPAAVQVNE